MTFLFLPRLLPLVVEVIPARPAPVGMHLIVVVLSPAARDADGVVRSFRT